MALTWEQRKARKLARHERRKQRAADRRDRPRSEAPVPRLRDDEVLPVFYLSQDQTTEPCATMTRAELRHLKRAGDGKFINHGKAFRLNRRGAELPERLLAINRDPETACSISLAEMEANVGIAGDLKDWTEGAPAPRHLVQRAQKKIRAIGKHEEGTYDEKAPLAFGSWKKVYPPEVASTDQPPLASGQ